MTRLTGTTTARRIVRWSGSGLMTALLSTAAAYAAPADACGTATLLDVELVSEAIPTEHVRVVRGRRDRHGRRDTWVERTPGIREKKNYLVTLQLGDVRYVGESSADAPWDFNPMRLVINDDIDVCVERDRLVLTRPGGKHYRATIVRAVRDADAR